MVFTCVTDTAPLVWSTSVNELVKVYYSSDQVNEPAVNIGGIFTVKLVNTTGQLESTATAYNVSSDYNGVNITCSNSVNDVSCSKTRSISVGENSCVCINLYTTCFSMLIVDMWYQLLFNMIVILLIVLNLHCITCQHASHINVTCY